MLHVIVDAKGRCLGTTSTGANGNEREEMLILIDRIKSRVKMPSRMIIVEADKGYDSQSLRQELLNRGRFPWIPWRRNRKEAPSKKEVMEFLGLSSIRWVIERTHAWIKRKYRRLTARWERRQDTWVAMSQATIILDWIKILLR